MDRSSGSPILEELLMYTPNSGNSSSSIGKGFLKFSVSHSFDLYYLSAFYLFVYLISSLLPKENKSIFPPIYFFQV